MSDSLRSPGPPSSHPQVPSSLESQSGSSGTGYTGGSYQQTPVPSGPSKPNHRTLLVSAAITVASSLIIYYLTTYLNRPKSDAGNNLLVVKQSTIDAWDSYETYENLYTTNALLFERKLKDNPNYPYLAEFEKESSKFVKDIETLKQKKDVDIDLLNVFDRRLENERTLLKDVKAYYEKLKKVAASSKPDTEKAIEFVNLMTWYTEYYKTAFEKSVNDIQLIANTLSDRYGSHFDMQKFLLIQIAPARMKSNDSLMTVLHERLKMLSGNGQNPSLQLQPVLNLRAEQIAGTWREEEGKLVLEKNGKMLYFFPPEDSARGTWKIDAGKLRLDAVMIPSGAKKIWIFNVNNLMPESCILTVDTDEEDRYFLKREN